MLGIIMAAVCRMIVSACVIVAVSVLSDDAHP